MAKVVFILESEKKILQQMSAALFKIDPEAIVRWFPNLNEFFQWLQKVKSQTTRSLRTAGRAVPALEEKSLMAGSAEEAGSEAEGAGESDQLRLFISQVEFLGAQHLGLLQKMQQEFTRIGLSTKEDPVSLVLTAFEDPAFKIEELENRILSNVIMKPFDGLILEQHLRSAYAGRHAVSEFAVAPFKSKAVVELLKRLEMTKLSSSGFETLSNREIPIGSVAKYYGTVFESKRQKSVMARVTSCVPVPHQPGYFTVRLTYFGADVFCISQVRRKILESSEKHEHRLSVDNSDRSLTIALIEHRPEIRAVVEPLLKRKLPTARVFVFESRTAFLKSFEPSLMTSEEAKQDPNPSDEKLKKGFDLMISGSRWASVENQELWKKIKEVNDQRIPKNIYFMISTEEHSDQEKRDWAGFFADIFYLPLEKYYFLQKLASFFGDAKWAEEPVIEHEIDLKLKIRTARPVEVEEISEAGISMVYDRAMDIGSFRELVLWQPYEFGAPELQASCNYVEPSAQAGHFKLHFVFFGLTDHLTKAIRNWIKSQYILSKQKG